VGLHRSWTVQVGYSSRYEHHGYRVKLDKDRAIVFEVEVEV
jgi:hypothetical protein